MNKIKLFHKQTLINSPGEYKGKVWPNFSQIQHTVTLSINMVYESSESRKYLLYLIKCSVCCIYKWTVFWYLSAGKPANELYLILRFSRNYAQRLSLFEKSM